MIEVILIFSCRFSKINQDVIAQLINTNQYQTHLNFLFHCFPIQLHLSKGSQLQCIDGKCIFGKKGKTTFFLKINIKIFKTYIMENQAQNHCSEWQRWQKVLLSHNCEVV